MRPSPVVASERKPGGPRRSRPSTWPRPRPLRRNAARPRLERLEFRSLMAASAGAGVAPVVVPHETLDQAAELGLISPGVSLGEAGSIGDGPDGAADVDWYTFTLNSPARVGFELWRQDPSSSFNGVLSLFNNDIPNP